MPEGMRCPSCGLVMHPNDLKEYPKGWDVTYICTNFECATYKKSGAGYDEEVREFEAK